MRRLTILVILSAALSGLLSSLVVSAIVFATIPDSGNVIHACYATMTGDLRVIDDASASCKSNETSLSWARSGLTGYEVIQETREADPGAFTVANARCGAGKSVLGGGFHGVVEINQNFPQTTGSNAPGWQVAVTNSGAFPYTFTAYAVCARLIP
jgi:hypothetical protein